MSDGKKLILVNELEMNAAGGGVAEKYQQRFLLLQPFIESHLKHEKGEI